MTGSSYARSATCSSYAGSGTGRVAVDGATDSTPPGTVAIGTATVGAGGSAGIGGRTAHAVADALKRLAERAQILTITHLPQIASAAEGHLRVEKVPGDPTHTRIERLSDEERSEELERMLGGAEFLSTFRR